MAASGAIPAEALADGALLLREPGMFAHNYGSLTPKGVMMAHGTYGLVIRLISSWLA